MTRPARRGASKHTSELGSKLSCFSLAHVFVPYTASRIAFVVPRGDNQSTAPYARSIAMVPIPSRHPVVVSCRGCYLALGVGWFRLLQIGRAAGQFAKPRSDDFETIDGVTLPRQESDSRQCCLCFTFFGAPAMVLAAVLSAAKSMTRSTGLLLVIFGSWLFFVKRSVSPDAAK